MRKPITSIPALRYFPICLLAIAAACVSIAHAQIPETRNLGVAPSGKRIALVIGNDAYQKVSKLEKAGNDATAMARELRAAGFEVLLHRDLNYHDMVKAVEVFSNRINGGDQVVVFFAGHGVQIKTGSYLLPIDIEASSESQVEMTAYGLADLTDKLSEAKASFALVMVDACRNNPLKSKGRSIGATRGLSAIEPPKGQMVVYSASKGQEALDRLSDKDSNPNGVFTRAFIARMKKPGVRIEDLMREVQDAAEQLAQSVSHEQRPAIYNESRGNFYFFGPTTVQVQPPAAVAIPPAPTLATPLKSEDPETQFWNEVKASGAREYLDAYLKQYPKGKFVALAKIELRKVDEKIKVERVKEAAAEREKGEMASTSNKVTARAVPLTIKCRSSYDKGIEVELWPGLFVSSGNRLCFNVTGWPEFKGQNCVAHGGSANWSAIVTKRGQARLFLLESSHASPSAHPSRPRATAHRSARA